MSRASIAIVGLALAVACAGSTAGSPDAAPDGDTDVAPDAAPGGGDGFPAGAIGFFLDTSCPSGWRPFADGVGRTLVPAAGDHAGTVVGTPLATNQRRGHRHDLALEVELPSVSFAGIAGEANHGVARSGRVQGTAATEHGEGDLPYLQLLVCEKTAPSGRTAPSGVIAFFAAPSCPTPWTELTADLQGRLLVALPAKGTPGATFGGPPLGAGEARTHTHPVAASMTAAPHGIALASGCCAGGYGAAGVRSPTAATAPASVDLPYVQLLACVAP